MTPFPLGRLAAHDERSRAFLAPAAGTVRTVNHSHFGGSLNQGDLGSCTGNAMAHALNTTPLRPKGRDLLTEEQAVALYSRATELDDFDGSYPPEDTGSDGNSVAKAARELGWITGWSHAFGLDHALQALVLNPVIIGINWYEGMFEPDSSGFITPTGRVAGGHEICLIGVTVRTKYVTAVQSWGNEWGLKGRFRMTWDVLERLLSEDGDVVAPVSSS